MAIVCLLVINDKILLLEPLPFSAWCIGGRIGLKFCGIAPIFAVVWINCLRPPKHGSRNTGEVNDVGMGHIYIIGLDFFELK